MSSVDRAFARYLARGEPADLAAVFDHTAAELLSVALHLTGDPHAAEDVLQETFLIAIERRRTSTPSEAGIRAWLLGILHNLARRRWRRRSLRPVESVGELEGSVAEPHESATAPFTMKPVMLVRLPVPLHVSQKMVARNPTIRTEGRRRAPWRSEVPQAVLMPARSPRCPWGHRRARIRRSRGA